MWADEFTNVILSEREEAQRDPYPLDSTRAESMEPESKLLKPEN